VTAGARERRWRIHADDFGVSPGVNRAVAAAFGAGRLDSASLVANAAHAEEAAALARANPGLRVGVHLNLTAQMGQRPVAPPERVPLLVDGGGRLKRGFTGLLLLSWARPGALARQGEAEMRAQIEWAADRGLRPAHLDSHRHVHMIPALYRVAERLRDEYRIPRLRRVNESLRATWAGAGLGRAWINGGLVKWAALRACARAAGRRGGPEEEYFYSVLHGTRLHGRALRRLRIPAPHRTAELCFHPACPEADRGGDPGLAAYRMFSPDRRREFEALMALDVAALEKGHGGAGG